VLASFRADGDALERWITNDALVPLRDEARVRLATLAGQVEHEEAVRVRVGAGESVCLRRWEPGKLAGGADRYLRDELAQAADDYFELERGEERTVLVTHPERALDPGEFEIRSR